MIKEVKRVLKEEGFAVVFTPNYWREFLGKIKRFIFRSVGVEEGEMRLHFGLITKSKFEKMLKKENLKFKSYYFDINIPSLSTIPILKFFSLNLLWVVRK